MGYTTFPSFMNRHECNIASSKHLGSWENTRVALGNHPAALHYVRLRVPLTCWQEWGGHWGRPTGRRSDCRAGSTTWWRSWAAWPRTRATSTETAPLPPAAAGSHTGSSLGPAWEGPPCWRTEAWGEGQCITRSRLGLARYNSFWVSQPQP